MRRETSKNKEQDYLKSKKEIFNAILVIPRKSHDYQLYSVKKY